jgi:hypothetical protein
MTGIGGSLTNFSFELDEGFYFPISVIIVNDYGPLNFLRNLFFAIVGDSKAVKSIIAARAAY